MKIALVAPMVSALIPEQGGTQAVLCDLAVALARRHEVTLIAPAGSVAPGVEVMTIDVDLRWSAQNLFRPQGWVRRAPDALTDAYGQVAGLLGSASFDVIHNHGADPQAIEVLTERHDLVHTLHLPRDPDMATAVTKHRTRLSLVAVSRALDQDWEGIADRVIHNGIPVADIGWSKSHDGYLLFAGRLSPEKGAADAIAIARRAGLPCKIVGSPYDPEYARRIEAMAGADVQIVGTLPRLQLWQLMSRATAVLVTSRWEEPFGLVAAEAQAAGCPVIAYGRGALPEVVAHGSTGWIVPEGDIASAASAVDEVSRLDRISIRHAAEERFDIHQMVRAYEELYASHAEKGERWISSKV